MILVGLILGFARATDLTLIEVTPQNGSKDNYKFCAAFNSKDYGFLPVEKFPSSPEDSTLEIIFKNFFDLGQSNQCSNYTGDEESIKSGAYVIVERGSCSFQEKAENIYSKGGGGLITVNHDDSIFGPAMENKTTSVSNMFVGIIGNTSYTELSDFAKKQDGWDKIRGRMYVPISKFDPTLIPIWLIAVSCLMISTQLAGYQTLPLSRASTGRRGSTSSDIRVIIDADSEVEFEDPPEFTSKNATVWLIVTTLWLLLLYFLYDYLVFVMIGIFCLFGSFSMANVIYNTILMRFSCTHVYKCPKNDMNCLSYIICQRGNMSIAGIILIICCLAFSITWFLFRHTEWAWILQDIIGYFFCIFTISELRLPNFKLLTLLLVGFCLYDVFMVYITPFLTSKGDSIMVAVATGGSNPEKMPFLFLVPHLNFSELNSLCNTGLNYSMLGFGDVIIPGLLGGYCCNFDIINGYSHFYFWWTFIASYSVGLVCTFVVLAITGAGQPALFFLVPSTVGSLLLCSYVRRETRYFWNGPKFKESLN